MILNLLINGLKFHPQDVPPWVIVSSRVDTGQVELLVEDNGIGFDVCHAERIFQPFQRLHGRSEYTGSGIGLSICRKIAERHGGTITVETIPGQGSSFTVILPQ